MKNNVVGLICDFIFMYYIDIQNPVSRKKLFRNKSDDEHAMMLNNGK